MKSGAKIVLLIVVVAAVAAMAFWAGTARGRGGKVPDAVKRPKATVRSSSGGMSSRPATAKSPHAALERIVRSIGDAGSAEPSAETAVQAGKDVRTAFLSVLADLDGGRIGEDGAVRRLKELRKGGDGVMLACLREMSDSADAAERLRSLAVIEAAYGSDGKPLTIDLDADLDSREVDIEAHRTHELVDMVGSALRDSDGAVRDAAFEVFNSLEGDVKFVLSRQILMGDDHEIKMKLMDATANTATTFAIGLSLDALGNSDESVKAAAGKNLTAVTGQAFSSQDEARAWWEANCDDFMTRANGSDDMNAVTVKETSDTEETPQNNHKKPQEKE